jgi:hypothetical protein
MDMLYNVGQRHRIELTVFKTCSREAALNNRQTCIARGFDRFGVRIHTQGIPPERGRKPYKTATSTANVKKFCSPAREK